MSNEKRLEQLRSVMMGSAGQEEKVEVNQRHLIDKILARYSAEYVLYRELMQNADDAQSQSVEIRFHSTEQAQETNKAPNLSALCNRITFKNDGMAFRPEDWTRLKRIAEGNPDEQKIGAFGVGFYSLFSVCENPFVSSGNQCMAFYFKGDQLFAKRGEVASTEVDAWTSFLMDLREPMEMPSFHDFAKFLATSMGFTSNLRRITVYFDSHIIFNITKKLADPISMAIDSKSMDTSSPQKMFTIRDADVRKIQLDVEKYSPPTLFSPLTNLLSMSLQPKPRENGTDVLPMDKANILLRIVTANLSVHVPKDYEREMERATKKKPPKTTKFQLVYTRREELDASDNSNASLKVFNDLVPFPHQGRVFIGFPTHQTTGCCSHMAARFIPTVERESIDFADRYISVWNKELLSIGGRLSRLVYNEEMNQVSVLYAELVGSEDLAGSTTTGSATNHAKQALEKRASHVLQSFTFHHSTPSSIVGLEQERQFFSSSRVPIQVMTSRGVRMITDARTLPEDQDTTDVLTTFVKTIPTLSPVVIKECKKAVNALCKQNLLRSLGFEDVLHELDTRSLNPAEMVACMQWWIQYDKKIKSTGRANDSERARFLNAAIVDCGEDRLLPLSHARWWINPKTIPPDMQVPDTTLPFSVSMRFHAPDLQNHFGQLKELSLLEWTRCIAQNKEFETSQVSEKVLSIISRGYKHLPAKDKAEICLCLKSRRCVPTKFGQKLPHEAYFTTVNLFDDLPIIHFQKQGAVGEPFLTDIGVRKHVDLQLVFSRLLADGSWSHVELVKYLTAVQSTVSDEEIRRLKQTPIFTMEGELPKEKEVEAQSGTLTTDGKPVMEKRIKRVYKRYKASDLYAPTDALKALKLPPMHWSGRWRSDSDEAKFMEKLGLRDSPPLDTILELASATNKSRELQRRALTYLVENKAKYGSAYAVDKIAVPFLPCDDGKTYAAPRDCFTNPDARVLGFHVLHPDLLPVRDKLEVRENPDALRLVQAFVTQLDTDHQKAKQRFEYMASRMGDIGKKQWHELRQYKLVPVVDTRSSKTAEPALLEPTHCYFESENANFHKELFIYVDFGQKANSFLRSCGVKDEPTTVELATMIVEDPHRFWNLSGGGERYLSVLRQIAGQFDQIRYQSTLMGHMRSKPFLVGIKRSSAVESASELEEGARSAEEDFVQYQLAKASDIFIIDDTMGQQIFSPLSAPMEPLLEEFYSHLGSDRLSRQIKEEYIYHDAVGATNRTKAIAEMIFERTPIIVYQMLNDNPQRKKEMSNDANSIKRNLKVMEAKKIRVIRKFKHTGEENTQPTTACVDTKKVTIYVSGTGEVDYYDIANTLCSLLFSRARFNDAIIVERYLTAKLSNLRRKGVPVDRILNIRRNVDSVASTPASNIDSNSASPDIPPTKLPPPLSPKQLDSYTRKVQEVFGDCQEGYIRQLLSREHENHAERVIEQLLNSDYPKSHQQSSVQDGDAPRVPEEKKMAKSTRLSDRLRSWITAPTPEKPMAVPVPQPERPLEPVKEPKLPKSENTITPNYTSSVKQNLKRAIHSCRPYSAAELFTQPRVNKVAESSHYCDKIPGHDLTHVGKCAGMEFYVHREVSGTDVVEQYGDAMRQFASIATLLGTVFDMKLSSLHIFYDVTGSTIAFNLNGSLFLNLRFYLALHMASPTDNTVTTASKRKEALIYWFMTICHELAHNFIADHNSEHEFYMSSFAEVYLERLIHHLSPPTATAAS